MKGKSPPSKQVLNLKFIIIVSTCVAILVLLFLGIRSNKDDGQISSDSHVIRENNNTPVGGSSGCAHQNHCNKIPASLAHAILHYTTSNITPQQTLNEISVSARVLEKKSPCNFLVFGLGHDSLMWNALNYGGRTVFLDEDEEWIKQISRRFPMLDSYKVTYNSKVSEAKDLMEHGMTTGACKDVSDPRESSCELALKYLPSEVYETKWDLIMVDAPTGFQEEAPGRMTAIYTAGLIARNREDGETDVFVHDVDRDVEDQFSKAFLCEGYMKKQEGRIRHFTIPSHKVVKDAPFCLNLPNQN